MANQALLDYIKSEREAGVVDEAIKQALLQKGWKVEDVDAAFTASKGAVNGVPLPGGNLPPATELLKKAWGMFTSRAGTYLGILVAPYALLLVISALVFGSDAFGIHFAGGYASEMRIAAMVALGVVIFAFVWASAALMVAIRDHDQRIGISESYSKAKSVLGGYFITSLLAGVIICIGFFLLLIPGIIFTLWFCLSIYVAVSENVYGWPALKRSKEYTKGLLGNLFVKYLLIIVISIVIGIITSLLSLLVGKQVGGFINSVVNILWTPVIYIYGYLLYKHVKMLKGI